MSIYRIPIIEICVRLRPVVSLGVLLAICGCGESTKDAMIRVAKERAASKALAAADEQDDTPAQPASPPASNPSASPVADVASLPSSTPDVESKTESTAVSENPQAAKPKGKRPRIVQHPQDISSSQIGLKSLSDLRENAEHAGGDKEKWNLSLRSLLRIGEGMRKMVEHEEVLGDILDEKGTPLLSWRVALLRFAGYEGLFRQFRLDEPWDSTHNRLLLNWVPDIYLNGDEYTSNSCFLGIRGPAFALNESGQLELERISDGKENTLAIVDVGSLVKIPWTKPEDLQLEDLDEVKNLFLSRWLGSIVGITAAGDVVRFPDNLKPSEKVKAFTAIAKDGPGKDFFETLTLDTAFGGGKAVASVPTEMDKEDGLATGGFFCKTAGGSLSRSQEL
jgi:hypothetical protein